MADHHLQVQSYRPLHSQQGRRGGKGVHLSLVCEEVVWNSAGAMQGHACHADSQSQEEHCAHTAAPITTQQLGAACARSSARLSFEQCGEGEDGVCEAVLWRGGGGGTAFMSE